MGASAASRIPPGGDDLDSGARIFCHRGRPRRQGGGDRQRRRVQIQLLHVRPVGRRHHRPGRGRARRGAGRAIEVRRGRSWVGDRGARASPGPCGRMPRGRGGRYGPRRRGAIAAAAALVRRMRRRARTTRPSIARSGSARRSPGGGPARRSWGCRTSFSPLQRRGRSLGGEDLDAARTALVRVGARCGRFGRHEALS